MEGKIYHVHQPALTKGSGCLALISKRDNRMCADIKMRLRHNQSGKKRQVTPKQGL